MERKRLLNLINENFNGEPVKLKNCGINSFIMPENTENTKRKLRVNIIALGDVGSNLLMGLKLLGGDVISEIGIFDLNENQLRRLEMEFNQMNYPPASDSEKNSHKRAGCIRTMPKIKIIDNDMELMDCDVLVFCATKSVPKIGASGDVRMMQLEANMQLIKGIGEKVKKSDFSGLVAVVSDPVDQLCKGMLDFSGLSPGQVRGFGLGVMAARAKYYAEKEDRFNSFLIEGRAYGPHGQDLVIANSVENYDHELSMDLTKYAVEANLRVRDLGFKPFLAPAISSAAISIILTLRGEYNYGSVFFGVEDADIIGEENAEKDNAEKDKPENNTRYEGAFVGVLSRLTEDGVEYEDRELPIELYERIEKAYKNLLM